MHGGSTRHIREAANKRLDELVMPAVSTLRTMMLRGESHAIRLKAAESILDRAGVVATKEVAVDNQVSITVSYQDVVNEALGVTGQAVQEAIEVAYHELPSGNGHEKTATEGGQDNGLEPD
jgi:hypothetical protein